MFVRRITPGLGLALATGLILGALSAVPVTASPFLPSPTPAFVLPPRPTPEPSVSSNGVQIPDPTPDTTIDAGTGEMTMLLAAEVIFILIVILWVFLILPHILDRTRKPPQDRD